MIELEADIIRRPILLLYARHASRKRSARHTGQSPTRFIYYTDVIDIENDYETKCRWERCSQSPRQSGNHSGATTKPMFYLDIYSYRCSVNEEHASWVDHVSS
jgi:hypothetical protein